MLIERSTFVIDFLEIDQLLQFDIIETDRTCSWRRTKPPLRKKETLQTPLRLVKEHWASMTPHCKVRVDTENAHHLIVLNDMQGSVCFLAITIVST